MWFRLFATELVCKCVLLAASALRDDSAMSFPVDDGDWAVIEKSIPKKRLVENHLSAEHLEVAWPTAAALTERIAKQGSKCLSGNMAKRHHGSSQEAVPPYADCRNIYVAKLRASSHEQRFLCRAFFSDMVAAFCHSGHSRRLRLEGAPSMVLGLLDVWQCAAWVEKMEHAYGAHWTCLGGR